MQSLLQILQNSAIAKIAPLDNTIPLDSYVSIDLSETNTALEHLDITSPDICQHYIDAILKKNKAQVAYGGYLEKRNLYKDKSSFNASGASARNIHLGVDFWSTEGTKVITPISGKVHSFKNNAVKGDYGPTIILEHKISGCIFYTLYGHLSVESLKGLVVGTAFKQGDTLAELGSPKINVNYAPHLHFQIIKDIQGGFGDYPGVCTAETIDFYSENCPDPLILLKLIA